LSSRKKSHVGKSYYELSIGTKIGDLE